MRLVAQTGREAGREFPLVRSVITIGRAPDNDIIPGDSQISRQHAKISKRGNEFIITDLGSTNGTFINDIRLSAPQVLRHGDRIRIGTTTLSCQMMPSARSMGEAVRKPVAKRGTSPLPFLLAGVVVLLVVALVLFAQQPAGADPAAIASGVARDWTRASVSQISGDIADLVTARIPVLRDMAESLIEDQIRQRLNWTYSSPMEVGDDMYQVTATAGMQFSVDLLIIKKTYSASVDYILTIDTQAREVLSSRLDVTSFTIRES